MPDAGLGELIASIGSSLFGDAGGSAAADTAAAALGGAATGGAAGAGLDLAGLAAAGLTGAGLSQTGSSETANAALGGAATGAPTGALGPDLSALAAAGLTTSDASMATSPSTPAAPMGPTVSGGVNAVGSAPTGSMSAISGAAPAAPSAVTSVAPASAAPVDLTSTGSTAGGITGGPAPTPSTSILDKLSPSNIANSAVDSALKNPLGIAATGGLLAETLLNKPGTPSVASSTAPLAATANNLSQTAPQLMGYLTSGTLPAGMKASVDEATKDAKTAAISNAAKNGQPTDPTQNTSLATQLASIDNQAVITTAQLGQQLLQSGLQETGLSDQIYSQLISASQTEDAATRDAISRFAASLSGTNSSINLKLA